MFEKISERYLIEPSQNKNMVATSLAVVMVNPTDKIV